MSRAAWMKQSLSMIVILKANSYPSKHGEIYGFRFVVFFAYADFCLKQKCVSFVSMLHSNTSPLESLFSVQRMRGNDMVCTYSSGILWKATNTKVAKTSGRNSNSYEYQFEEDALSISSMTDTTTKKLFQRCKSQHDHWNNRILGATCLLPKAQCQFLHTNFFHLSEQPTLSKHLIQFMQEKFSQSSHIQHLIRNKKFNKWYMNLGTISPSMSKCYQYLSIMKPNEVHHLEYVLGMIHEHIFAAVTKHFYDAAIVTKPLK